MIRLGIVHNNRLGTGMEIRFRPAYYDILELDASHITNSNVTMFDFKTIFTENHLGLRSLDLVNIETFNVSRTLLPGDGGLGWKVKFGFEAQNNACVDCMTFNLIGGLGKAIQLTTYSIAFGMLDTFAQTEYADSGTIGAIVRTGMVGSPINGWKTNFTIGNRTYFNGSQSSNRLIRWENRFGTQRDWDIRISYEKQYARELQLAISIYW